MNEFIKQLADQQIEILNKMTTMAEHISDLYRQIKDQQEFIDAILEDDQEKRKQNAQYLFIKHNFK